MNRGFRPFRVACAINPCPFHHEHISFLRPALPAPHGSALAVVPAAAGRGAGPGRGAGLRPGRDVRTAGQRQHLRARAYGSGRGGQRLRGGLLHRGRGVRYDHPDHRPERAGPGLRLRLVRGQARPARGRGLGRAGRRAGGPRPGGRPVPGRAGARVRGGHGAGAGRVRGAEPEQHARQRAAHRGGPARRGHRGLAVAGPGRGQ